MFEELRIKNFQAHSSLRIQFDRCITTIIGSSDVGKSAVIRAIRWICQNKPQGTAFVKHGSDGARVGLKVDGRRIERRRGKATNEYILDGTSFKSFSAGVPEPIEDVLNIAEINFQRQHDAPFWFSLSSGEVSRQLNSIVDLSVIDSSLSSIGSIVRSLQESIRLTRDRLSKAEEKRKLLEWVKVADLEFQRIEKSEVEILRFEEERDELWSLLTHIGNERETLLSKIEIIDGSSRVILFGERLIDCQTYCDDLNSILGRVVVVSKQARMEIPSFSSIERIVGLYSDVEADCDLLEDLLRRVAKARHTVGKLEDSLQNIEEELHEATDGKCPLCGAEMS